MQGCHAVISSKGPASAKALWLQCALWFQAQEEEDSRLEGSCQRMGLGVVNTAQDLCPLQDLVSLVDLGASGGTKQRG
jgi:hypothetical protein